MPLEISRTTRTVQPEQDNVNGGHVRAPVQCTFAQPLEPFRPMEISITRMAATTEKDGEEKGYIRTMGRKHIVPYGLYRAHGFISAPLAQGNKGTGFSEGDLALLWEALSNMFDHDRSAARGEMSNQIVREWCRERVCHYV